MDIQTIVVILIAAFAAAFLIRKYARAARGSGGCGCACGGDCPSQKKADCGGEPK